MYSKLTMILKLYNFRDSINKMLPIQIGVSIIKLSKTIIIIVNLLMLDYCKISNIRIINVNLIKFQHLNQFSKFNNVTFRFKTILSYYYYYLTKSNLCYKINMIDEIYDIF